MQIIHTSPTEITKINKNGLFEDCLFFADDAYNMSAADTIYTYTLDVDSDEILDVRALYDVEIIAHISSVLNVDLDTAADLLTDRQNVFDVDRNGDDSRWLQAQQGKCAKKMGFVGTKIFDEQGTAYIVPMLGRENDLKLANINK